MDMPKLEINYVNVSELKPNPRNPRKNEKAVQPLIKSIENFGWTSPILATRDNMIIAGHTRLMAAKKRGIEEVPVIYLDIDPDDANIYMIADNKLTEIAEWDDDLLSHLFSEMKELGKDLELTGFDLDEIARLTEPGVKQGLTDDDDVPEPPAEPITKPGDLWLLGAYWECENCGKRYEYEDGKAMVDAGKECKCGKA